MLRLIFLIADSVYQWL